MKEEAFEEDRVRRLRWRCRRGLLELDLWLQRFVMAGMNELSEGECATLERLLNEADSDLLAWLDQRDAPPLAYAEMLARIRMAV